MSEAVRIVLTSLGVVAFVLIFIILLVICFCREKFTQVFGGTESRMERKSFACLPCYRCFGSSDDDSRSGNSRESDMQHKVGIKYQLMGEFPVSTTVTPVQPVLVNERKTSQSSKYFMSQGQQPAVKLVSNTQENAFLGEIHFNLGYRYDENQLIISINSVKHLPRLGEDVVGVSVRAAILPEAINIVQTKVLPPYGRGSASFRFAWDETFVFSEFPSKHLYWHKIQLALRVSYNYQRPEESAMILGTTEVKLTPLLSSDNVPDVAFHCRRYFQPLKDDKRGSGKLLISSTFTRSPPTLSITFLQSRYLDMPKTKISIANLRANVRFTDSKGSLIREESTNLSTTEGQNFTPNSTVAFIGYREEEFLSGVVSVQLVAESDETSSKSSPIKVGSTRLAFDSVPSGYLEEVFKSEGRPLIQWHSVKMSRDTS